MMKLIIQYGGWVLAIILAVVCGVVYFSRPDATDVAAEPEAVAAPTDVLSEASSENAALDAATEEIETLRHEVASLQAELAAHAAEAPAAAEPAVPAEEEAPELESPAADAAGQSRGERIANAQLAIVADMTYKGLFDELGVSPEMRDSMKEIIGAHMLEAQQVALAAMQSKDQKAKDVHARMEALEAETRAELAGSLTAEQLAAWDAYEPVADQILYERLVDGQLNMMAAGLADENRVVASQVMAEELVREFDLFDQSEELYTLDNYNNAQARALQSSLERLSEALPEDQYAMVDGFVSQAMAMFNAMAEQGE